MTFESAMLSHVTDSGVEVPIDWMVDIEVETQRQWQVQTHNELMIQLLQMGIFDPQMLLENMIFEGKEAVLKQISDRQKQQAEQAAMMQAMQAAGGGQGGPSPEEQQAAEAQAQAEQAVQNLPDPKALAQAGGASQGSIVMRQ